MKINYALMAIGIVLVAASIYFFSQRGQLAATAYRLAIEREGAVLEAGQPDRTDDERARARQRMFEISDEYAAVESEQFECTFLSISSLVLGLAAGGCGVFRSWRRSPAPPARGLQPV
jgi:hypothetical protein